MTQTATCATFLDGFYTVATDYEHRTFRVHTQDANADFAPGKQVIGFLRGPNNEADYVNFAFIIDGRLVPWNRFKTGYHLTIEAARFLVSPGSHQAESGKYYAQTSGNCYRCNRMLTDPLSVELGIGPTCRNRM